jgi:hypothetical protein
MKVGDTLDRMLPLNESAVLPMLIDDHVLEDILGVILIHFPPVSKASVFHLEIKHTYMQRMVIIKMTELW